jgi:hypothetical protein
VPNFRHELLFKWFGIRLFSSPLKVAHVNVLETDRVVCCNEGQCDRSILFPRTIPNKVRASN